ncbi:MAG TPA: hypothetical protein VFN67_31130 [Polyangiales bacterium]|nr:hypothetical protein [Polyangiales bacterium]
MRARCRAVLPLILVCGCAAEAQDGDLQQATHDDDFKGCPELTARFEPGLQADGDHFAMKLVSAIPSDPERYLNSWTVEVESLDGSSAADTLIERSQTFMPVHGHDGRVVPEIGATAEVGEFHVERLNFSMRGPWEVRFWLRSPTLGDDYVVFHVCVAK